MIYTYIYVILCELVLWNESFSSKRLTRMARIKFTTRLVINKSSEGLIRVQNNIEVKTLYFSTFITSERLKCVCMCVCVGGITFLTSTTKGTKPNKKINNKNVRPRRKQRGSWRALRKIFTLFVQS